jgi:hypothetical protein
MFLPRLKELLKYGLFLSLEIQGNLNINFEWKLNFRKFNHIMQ